MNDLTNADLYECAGNAHGEICTYKQDCQVGEELYKWEEETTLTRQAVECMDGTWQLLTECQAGEQSQSLFGLLCRKQARSTHVEHIQFN